jgi:hypothetical protein
MSIDLTQSYKHSIHIKMAMWGDDEKKQYVHASASIVDHEWRMWWKVGNKIVKRRALNGNFGPLHVAHELLNGMTFTKP